MEGYIINSLHPSHIDAVLKSLSVVLFTCVLNRYNDDNLLVDQMVLPKTNR